MNSVANLIEGFGLMSYLGDRRTQLQVRAATEPI